MKKFLLFLFPKLKILNLWSWLLIFHLSTAQILNRVPDSLKKYTYKELSNKITENFKDKDNNYIYAKTYLLKARKEKNIDKIIDGYSIIGSISHSFEVDLKYSDTAISIARTKMPNALSHLYYIRGQIYYNDKMLKKALEYFLRARNCSDRSSKDLNIRINYSIGMIKNTQGNYEEAIDIYKNCEQEAKENKYSYLVYVLGLSELYNKVDKIELSEEYVAKGILLCNKNDLGYYYLPYFISNRGKNYYKRKQYQNAIKDLSSPLNIIQNNGDYSNYAENNFYIGECYHYLLMEEKATNYYKKVDSVFTVKNDIYPLTIGAYARIIDFYKKNEDFKNVIFYSDQFIKADKVLYDNYKYLTNKIVKTYDIQEIISSKQAVILSLKADRVKTYWGFGILLLTTMGVGGFGMYQYHLKKRYRSRFEKILKKTVEINSNENKEIKTSKTKIKDIGITKEMVSLILKKLDHFEKKKKYLEPNITVQMLSNAFETNSKYVSKIVNVYKGKTFIHYINDLRIEYAIIKLQENRMLRKYTIQALAIEFGFNNIDSFSSAFYKKTGLRPAYFIKELNFNKMN